MFFHLWSTRSLSTPLSLSGNRIVLFPCHTLKPFTSQGDIFQAPLVPFIPGCCEGSRKTLLVRVKFQIAFWKRLYCFQSVYTTKHLLVAFVKLIWYWYVWSVLGVGIYACHILVTICRLSSCVDLFAHAQNSFDMLWLYLIHLQASSLGLLTRKIHSHSHY